MAPTTTVPGFAPRPVELPLISEQPVASQPRDRLVGIDPRQGGFPTGCGGIFAHMRRRQPRLQSAVSGRLPDERNRGFVTVTGVGSKGGMG